jgi:hypothetical protein
MRRQPIERESPIIYPQTAQLDAADDYFGQRVADHWSGLSVDN